MEYEFSAHGRDYIVKAQLSMELWWTDTKSGLRMTHVASFTVRCVPDMPGAWMASIILLGLKLTFGSRRACA